jgi:hypothetical protein
MTGVLVKIYFNSKHRLEYRVKKQNFQRIDCPKLSEYPFILLPNYTTFQCK